MGMEPRVMAVGMLLRYTGVMRMIRRWRRGCIILRWLVFQDPCEIIVAAFAVPSAVAGLAAVAGFAARRRHFGTS